MSSGKVTRLLLDGNTLGSPAKQADPGSPYFRFWVPRKADLSTGRGRMYASHLSGVVAHFLKGDISVDVRFFFLFCQLHR